MKPSEMFVVRDGVLFAGGLPVDAIVSKIGAPLYLYDAGVMRGQYEKLAAAIPPDAKIYYSVKANPNRAVAEIFQRLGAGAEVASAGELLVALKAGFKPRDIIFAGPGKRPEELELAIKKRIGSINVESATELDRIIKIASSVKKRVRIAFRVNLDFRFENRDAVMIGGARKFGTDDDKLAPLVKTAVDSGWLDIAGFHCFPGTQIADSRILGDIYQQFAEWAMEFAETVGVDVETLNFGGGLGIPFGEDDKELDVASLGARLRKIRKETAKSSRLKSATFLLEPGRYLTGPGGIYISRVIDKKESRGRLYIVTDGGIHHALVPIVRNKNYPTFNISRMREKRKVECAIVGPLCSSADEFSRNVKLAKPEIGDLIGIFNSGAYGYSAGMILFLSHPAPAEALVDDGKLYLIRKRAMPGQSLSEPVEL